MFRDVNLGANILAVKAGEGRIRFANLAFEAPNFPAATTIHEIAHNWDSPEEYASIGDFRALPNWQVVGGLWKYSPCAGFASEYAKTNPYEDFAESVTVYFTGDKAASQWQAKWNYVDGFLDGMSV